MAVKNGKPVLTVEEVDEETARDAISSFAESTWDCPSELADDVDVSDAAEYGCLKRIDRRLSVSESRKTKVLSKDDRRSFDPNSFFVDRSVDERHELEPNGYTEATFNFRIPGTGGWSNCSSCSGRGRQPCDQCGSTGTRRCSICGGDGVEHYVDAEDEKCVECAGRGHVRCEYCDGAGDVTCDRCDGHGENYSIDHIQRRFSPEEQVQVSSKAVPVSFVNVSDGTHVTTRDVKPGDGVVKQELEYRRVPTMRVTYVYDEKEYELFVVDGLPFAEHYPRSIPRWGVAVSGTAIFAAALIFGYFRFL